MSLCRSGSRLSSCRFERSEDLHCRLRLRCLMIFVIYRIHKMCYLIELGLSAAPLCCLHYTAHQLDLITASYHDPDTELMTHSSRSSFKPPRLPPCAFVRCPSCRRELWRLPSSGEGESVSVSPFRFTTSARGKRNIEKKIVNEDGEGRCGIEM